MSRLLERRIENKFKTLTEATIRLHGIALRNNIPYENICTRHTVFTRLLEMEMKHGMPLHVVESIQGALCDWATELAQTMSADMRGDGPEPTEAA